MNIFLLIILDFFIMIGFLTSETRTKIINKIISDNLIDGLSELEEKRDELGNLIYEEIINSLTDDEKYFFDNYSEFIDDGTSYNYSYRYISLWNTLGYDAYNKYINAGLDYYKLSKVPNKGLNCHISISELYDIINKDRKKEDLLKIPADIFYSFSAEDLDKSVKKNLTIKDKRAEYVNLLNNVLDKLIKINNLMADKSLTLSLLKENYKEFYNLIIKFKY